MFVYYFSIIVQLLLMSEDLTQSTVVLLKKYLYIHLNWILFPVHVSMHIASAPPSPRLNIITVINMMCKHHILLLPEVTFKHLCFTAPGRESPRPRQGRTRRDSIQVTEISFYEQKTSLVGGFWTSLMGGIWTWHLVIKSSFAEVFSVYLSLRLTRWMLVPVDSVSS